MTLCNTFWGSHGCDLPPGHDGNHKCINTWYDMDDVALQELCCENDGEFTIYESGTRIECAVFSLDV